jgi:hypothetical protein
MARVRAFRKLQPPEALADVSLFLRRLQDNVVDAFSLLTEVPLLDFVWKRDVVLTAGVTTPVPHGLGRAWRGYLITRSNAAATLYAPTSQTLPERFLELVPSATVTVDLFMF